MFFSGNKTYFDQRSEFAAGQNIPQQSDRERKNIEGRKVTEKKREKEQSKSEKDGERRETKRGRETNSTVRI